MRDISLCISTSPYPTTNQGRPSSLRGSGSERKSEGFLTASCIFLATRLLLCGSPFQNQGCGKHHRGNEYENRNVTDELNEDSSKKR